MWDVQFSIEKNGILLHEYPFCEQKLTAKEVKGYVFERKFNHKELNR